jgi:transcriptional regulator with XRE-family HTH domain
MVKEEQIPKVIKRMRIERQLTQQEVAAAMGVTKGYISRIENSDTAPPVGTLISLAQALGVDFNAFFDTKESEVVMTFTPEDQRFLMARDKTAALRYAHLAIKFPNRWFEPYIIYAKSGEQLSQPMQHHGQEFWFVVSGEFEAEVNEEIHIIKKGDSLYFNSGYLHRGRCLSKDGGEILAIVWNADKDNKA